MRWTRHKNEWRICEVASNLLVAGIVYFAASAGAADTATSGTLRFDEGQKVEVREGDAWSAASIVKHEGRKYLIHYNGADSSTDEWVTTDRIRSTRSIPAVSQVPTTQPGTSDLPSNRVSPKPQLIFPNGKQVEVKWGGMWRKAIIINRRGEWYLINYENIKTFREWVEPWRVRAVGSTEDRIGFITPNPWVNHNEGPPQEKPGNPPATGAQAALTGIAPNIAKDQTRSAAPDVRITPSNRANATMIETRNVPLLAHLPPDAIGPENALRQWRSAVLRNDPTDLFFSSTAIGMAAVVYRPIFSMKPERISVERFDLATGKLLNRAALPPLREPLDLSADGRLLLVRTSVFGPGKQKRLEVWQVDAGDDAKLVTAFQIFSEDSNNLSTVEWAKFVDGDHLMAGAQLGEFGLWNFRNATAVWLASNGGTATPAFSANRKYFAFASPPAVVVIDVFTGKPVSRFDLNGVFPMRLSFSPDGTKLAAESSERLDLFDTVTGATRTAITVLGASGLGINWLDDGYILVDRSRMVSLSKQAVVWTYSGPDLSIAHDLAGDFGGRFWYIAQKLTARLVRINILLPASLPEDAVKGILSAIGDPPMTLKPGMSVSVEVSVDGDLQQKVTEVIVSKLKANGISVADGQRIKLVAHSEPGETREMSYRPLIGGAFAPPSKISVATTKQSIEFLAEDGKSLWKWAGTTSPASFLSIKPGQTLEEAVAEQTKPSAVFFENVHIPKYLPKTRGGFGTSLLTAEGVRPGKKQ